MKIASFIFVSRDRNEDKPLIQQSVTKIINSISFSNCSFPKGISQCVLMELLEMKQYASKINIDHTHGILFPTHKDIAYTS